MATRGRHAGTDKSELFENNIPGIEGQNPNEVLRTEEGLRVYNLPDTDTDMDSRIDINMSTGADAHTTDPSQTGSWNSMREATDAYHGEVRKVRKRRGSSRRRRKRRNRIILAVVLAILAALLVAGAMAWRFVAGLNDSMDLGPDSSTIKAALTQQSDEQPFYVLLMGSDSREGINGRSAADERSDVMVLVRLDKAHQTVTLLSIPRDTPWIDPAGNIKKINDSYYQLGGSGTINAVEQLTGIRISHYGEIHMSQFRNLVDYLGGLEIDVPTAMDFSTMQGERLHLEPGRQVLDGRTAEVVVRDRFDYQGILGDVGRQRTNRAVIEALVNSIKSRPLQELPSTMDEVADLVSTDMKVPELVQLLNDFRGNITYYSGTGPTDGDFNQAVENGLWLCYENPAGWERVMQVVDSGGDPQTVSYDDDVVTIAGTGGQVVQREGDEQPAEEPEPESAPEPEPEGAGGQYLEDAGEGGLDAYDEQYY